MNRRVPNGTHGGVRGRKSPLETFSYSIVVARLAAQKLSMSTTTFYRYYRSSFA